jgi:hypothetical protein
MDSIHKGHNYNWPENSVEIAIDRISVKKPEELIYDP